jgi:DNA-nicking Smr family endonuclease
MVKDIDLFQAAMGDVTPLKGRRHRPPSESKPKRAPGREPAAIVASAVRRAPAAAADFAFDRDIDRALARGRRSPEAKLDLHGMTLAAAERAVARFLEEAAALDLRVVLIVTGKGLRPEGGRIVGGRIRAEFPGWLERPTNRARVRGLKPAHPRHGGSGAFYVLLRRSSRPPVSAR